MPPYDRRTDPSIPLAERIEFTDEMTVELVKSDFDDRWVVAAARTSTQGWNADGTVSSGLIHALMRDRHGSPFEHMFATWQVSAPIVVWREHHRHRIASYNEQSGRYMQMPPLFYVVPEHRPLRQEGKPMDYEYHDATDGQLALVHNVQRRQAMSDYQDYENLLHADVMREVARMHLPLNLMSTCWVSMNARALLNFLSLRVRADEDEAMFPSKPQWEINQVADAYEADLKRLAPITHASFVKAMRVSP